MMSDMEQHSSTPFNMALATLQRIDLLLRTIQEAPNVIVELHALTSLYKETHPFLNDYEKKEGTGMLNGLHSSIRADGYVAGQYNMSVKLPVKMYNFEIWMREKLYQYGLLMNKGDDPNSALGGGWS